MQQYCERKHHTLVSVLLSSSFSNIFLLHPPPPYILMINIQVLHARSFPQSQWCCISSLQTNKILEFQTVQVSISKLKAKSLYRLADQKNLILIEYFFQSNYYSSWQIHCLIHANFSQNFVCLVSMVTLAPTYTSVKNIEPLWMFSWRSKSFALLVINVHFSQRNLLKQERKTFWKPPNWLGQISKDLLKRHERNKTLSSLQ